MGRVDLEIEITKRDNKIKDLLKEIEAQKSDYKRLEETAESNIKTAVDEFNKCYDKLTNRDNKIKAMEKEIEERKESNDRLFSELFHLKQKRLVKLSIWIGGLRK